jgi:hypothetical protein
MYLNVFAILLLHNIIFKNIKQKNQKEKYKLFNYLIIKNKIEYRNII